MVEISSLARTALTMLACAVLASLSGPTRADALRIEPVLLEVYAPNAAATLTLRNEGDADVSMQIRVFKWTQVNGVETLQPSTEVVASPPLTTLPSKSDYVARIVRLSRQPLHGEESFRILVDQLPRSDGKSARQVNLVIRQSIPVFFSQKPEASAAVTWSLARDGAQLRLVAQNRGDRRMRLAGVKLRDAGGRMISLGNGLVGYVLSGATMSWTLADPSRRFGSAGPVQLDLQTDKGPVHEVVPGPSER
jgi:fimbrial chaperone protein